MKTFPELIRYWREHAGLSLSQAAAKAGMTKAHLWELEDGRARNPTIKTLAGLATAYNADLPYLAQLAAAALSSEVQPVGSERSDDDRSVHAAPIPSPETPESGDGWLTIDSAPRDTDVLLFCPDRAISNPARIELGRAVMTHGQERGWSFHSWATHWRPLPPPPETPAQGSESSKEGGAS